MKKLLLLATAAFLATSCSGTKKIKPITAFTERLAPNSTYSISLKQPEKLANFYNQLIFAQNQGMVVYIDPIKQHKAVRLALSENFASMPSVIDGNIYSLSSNGTVSSFNIDNHQYNWKTHIAHDSKNIIAGTISYSAGKLYITAGLELTVLDAITGKETLKKGLPDIAKNYPLIISNALIMQTAGNKLVAYNKEHWKQVWFYETWPEYISTNSMTAPIIVYDVVLSGFSTGQLVANKVADGAELWQINLMRESDAQISYRPLDLSCQPILQDRFLYIASNNNNLIKLDLTNASIVWKKHMEDITSMSISGDALFVTNNARQVASVSILDGSVIWTNDLVTPNDKKKNIAQAATFLPPLVTSEGLYVFSSDSLGFRFDNQTGVLIESFTVPSRVKYYLLNQNNIILFTDSSAYKLQ